MVKWKKIAKMARGANKKEKNNTIICEKCCNVSWKLTVGSWDTIRFLMIKLHHPERIWHRCQSKGSEPLFSPSGNSLSFMFRTSEMIFFFCSSRHSFYKGILWIRLWEVFYQKILANIGPTLYNLMIWCAYLCWIFMRGLGNLDLHWTHEF